MPNDEDFQELIKNTNIVGAVVNGIKGAIFRSKNNGNKIFLPFAGIKTSVDGYINESKSGYYWSGCIAQDTYYDLWESYRWYAEVCALYVNTYEFLYTPQNSNPNVVSFRLRQDGLTIRAVNK